MFQNCGNTKEQGNIGLGTAIAYFTKQCCTVSIPINDSQAYDLIIDDCGLKKVQVKTASKKNKSGSYEVDLRTTGGNQSFHTSKPFNHKEVDYLFVLTESNEKYLIPTKAFTSRTTISVGKKYQDFLVE